MEAGVSSSAATFAFSDVALGFGSAWNSNRQLTRSQIDARTLRNVRQVTVGRAPEAVGVGVGSVWVANSQDDSVSHRGLDAPRA